MAAVLLAVDVIPISVGGVEGLGRGEYTRVEMACEFVEIGMGGGGDDGEARGEAELGAREMLMGWAGCYDEYLRDVAGGVLSSLGWLEK